MVSRHRISEPCLTVQLSGLLGYVDYLGRPIVRLSIVGLQDEVPALVDTGCNMNVVASRSIAREAGLVTTGETRDSGARDRTRSRIEVALEKDRALR